MPDRQPQAIVIGAGPAGLMAAETLSAHGIAVDVFDAMPSPARKFLLAGKGGLNLTHSEPLDAFIGRYGERAGVLAPMLREFGPEQLCRWVHDLGIKTFVGTSGRIFPMNFKAAPLLRAWLRRLKGSGVRLHARHRWIGWDGDHLCFETPQGKVHTRAKAVLLALGGASWPQLGSDGAWAPLLEGKGLSPAPLRPANCGFDVGWSEIFHDRFAGAPLKPVTLSFAGHTRRGEVMITETGIEGGLVYALSAPIRDAIDAYGAACVTLDLKPDWSEERLRDALSRPRGSRSLSSHMERASGLKGAALGLLREIGGRDDLASPSRLAALIKALPLTLAAPRPLAEAISSAGGLRFEEMDESLMVTALPGLFAAGEMLDWEAPTGGYLLTACFSTGYRAGKNMAAWLKEQP